MILREAIEVSGFQWKEVDPNLPVAMMTIFQQTGVKVKDPATKLEFKRLELLAAVDFVFKSSTTTRSTR